MSESLRGNKINFKNQMTDKVEQNDNTSSKVQPETSAKSVTYSRGWELLFFFSEACMIVFYCVGTTFTEHGHNWSTNPAEIALQ
jgi:hypothetical protein